MKRKTVLALVLLGAMLGSACGGDEEKNDPGHIRFSIAGTAYAFEHGPSEFGDVPVGMFWMDTDSSGFIMAGFLATTSSNAMNSETNNYVYLAVDFPEAGTGPVEGDFTNANFESKIHNGTATTKIMGEKFVVTFTRAAEIDGYVEGKFTATGVSIRTRPSEGGSYIVTLSNATISDGTFSSRRLVDEFPPLIP